MEKTQLGAGMEVAHDASSAVSESRFFTRGKNNSDTVDTAYSDDIGDNNERPAISASKEASSVKNY